MEPISFREFRARMEFCGLYAVAGARSTMIFQRVAMGVGTPSLPVVFDGDDALVMPPTVELAMSMFSLSPAQFWSADAIAA